MLENIFSDNRKILKKTRFFPDFLEKISKKCKKTAETPEKNRKSWKKLEKIQKIFKKTRFFSEFSGENFAVIGENIL